MIVVVNISETLVRCKYNSQKLDSKVLISKIIGIPCRFAQHFFLDIYMKEKLKFIKKNIQY